MGMVLNSVSNPLILQRPSTFRTRTTILDYVGYWPTQSTVVVAHQGTNPAHMCVYTYSQIDDPHVVNASQISRFD